MVQQNFDLQKMPLLDHLIELRQRLLYAAAALIVGFIICFYFAQSLFDFLAQPLSDLLLSRYEDETRTPRIIYTSLIEPFFAQIKIAFFFSAFITCPIFLLQLWKFVAPGLYRDEKTAFAPFLIASPILFFTGAALVYYVILPFAWSFFIQFETVGSPTVLPVELEPKVSEYVSLTMRLIFAFGICFQLPVLMTLLARAGIASAEGMAKSRKYAIVAVFVVAAIFTPPDPISQLSLAIPIILLYEISIWMARMVEKKRAQKEQELRDELEAE